MACSKHYTKWFEEKDNRNWLKVSVGLIITKRGLAPFVENTLDTWKNVQVAPGSNCSACSTAELVPCDHRNKICKGKHCKFHQGVTYRPCPNKICDAFRQEIITQHRFKGPSWRNTNARDWCSNTWEVAKAFLPPDGYDKITTSDDTDLNGVVSVLINCLLFEQYIPDLAIDGNNVGTKVRDIGRKLRHASKLEVTDADLKQLFDDMRALFLVPKHLAANTNAQNTVDLLNKLETDNLQIERTDIIAAIKDVVTSLEHLSSTIDPEALNDTIHKLHEIQQEIEKEVEEHKRTIDVLANEKKIELKQLAIDLTDDIEKKSQNDQHRQTKFEEDILREVKPCKEVNEVFETIKAKSGPIISMFQDLFSRTLTTHVGNQFKHTIYAMIDFELLVVDNIIKEAEASARSIDGGFEYSTTVSSRYSQAGFKEIAPEKNAREPFRYSSSVAKPVFIWIYFVDQNNKYYWLCKGLKRIPDQSVFVDRDGKVNDAKYGTLFTPAN